MNTRVAGILFSALSVAAAGSYHLCMPPEYSRIGLLAGVGMGLILGTTVPVEDRMRARLHRAIRTAAAFAATTGLGYGIYKGQLIGISWGVGGLVGCVAGGLTGQMGRSLLAKEDSPGN